MIIPSLWRRFVYWVRGVEGGVVPAKGPFLDPEFRCGYQEPRRFHYPALGGRIRVCCEVKRSHMEGDVQVIEEIKLVSISFVSGGGTGVTDITKMKAPDAEIS